MTDKKNITFYPSDKLKSLVKKLMMFPGVGERTAMRFAIFLLQAPKHFVEGLARDIITVKDKVKLCSRCFFIAENDLCRFCEDETRSRRKICVVEGIEDVISVERSGSWDGLYHVLWGLLSAQDGADVSQLKIKELIGRVISENIEEVLIMTDTSVEGEATAMYIKKVLSKFGVKITRPALGIPFGAEVEFMDTATLRKAILSRQEG